MKYAHVPVRVNLVCPGHCETPLVKRLFENNPGMKERLIIRYPMGRLGEEDEIAKAVLYLASDDASFVTGTELAVDGGFLAV